MDNQDPFGRPLDPGPAPDTTGAPVHARTPLSPDDALTALAYAQGNPAVAAERMGITHPDGAAHLLATLALDESIHPRAASILRFMQLAKLLGSLQYVEATLLEKLEQMDGKEVARTYTAMVLAAELLTKSAAPSPAGSPGATQNNVTINLLRLLPPEVREAMQALLPADSAAPSPNPNLVMPLPAVMGPVRSGSEHGSTSMDEPT